MRRSQIGILLARLSWAVFLALSVESKVFAEPKEPADSANAIDFDRDIVPILTRNCLSCHDAEDPAGGLDLTRRDSALAGGESGLAALTPGDPDRGQLVDRVAAKSMPPPKSGRSLSDREIEILRTWVRQGSTWPEGRVLNPFEFTTDSRAGLDWWSLRPPQSPPVPAVVGQATSRSPVDAFLIERLAREGLSFSSPADRATWIRRAKFDLLGLPPSPEEIADFLVDDSPQAYERVIDRFLASPRYGERWARHWLDVARFAESNGYETNTARANAWPYRDWVIRAFNDDLPYPTFIRDQLAGDQFGEDAATGFLVAGAHDIVGIKNIEGQLQQRANDLDDILSTTITAFLGVTIGCAKCHNHKFDPITQVDYYAIQAIFAGVQHGEREVQGADSEKARRRAQEIRERLAYIEERSRYLLASVEPLAAVPNGASASKNSPVPAELRRPVDPLGSVDRFAPVLAKRARFTVLATNGSEPCLDELAIYSPTEPTRNIALASSGAQASASGVYSNGALPIHQIAHLNDGLVGNNHSWISNEVGVGWAQIELPKEMEIDRVEWARDREGTYRDRLPTRYRIEVQRGAEPWRAVATSEDRAPFVEGEPSLAYAENRLAANDLLEYRSLLAERESLLAESRTFENPRMYVGTFSAPEPTRRLYRGEPMQPREVVAPGMIACLGGAPRILPEASESERRLELANWIGARENPRAARVIVNRVWQHHFGDSLTRSPSDLGWHGGLPSHPELLDYLAVDFMERGWSIKSLHRTLLLSDAYRQSSGVDSKARDRDADNRLLWRYSPRRLEAEPIRDAILSVSGKLDERMGGPGYDAFLPNSNYVKVYLPKVEFGPAEWRRMIYEAKPRMEQDPTFGAFDCPDAAATRPKRARSTTALQALNLLNGSFVNQQAGFFADRLAAEAPGDVEAQVRRAFSLAFGRPPEDDEKLASRQLIERHGLAAFCRALFNANEFVFVN